jgi:hypothetical protein
LSGVISTPIENLVSNPDWGKINFETARNDLELIFDLSNHLKLLPIKILPDSIAANFVGAITRVGQTIQKIRDFNIETTGTPALRDQLVGEIKSHAEAFLTTTQGWIPFLAYQKGDIQKNVKELTNAVTTANQLLDSAKLQIEDKNNEIAKIVTATREASASAGVGVFTQDFQQHATTLQIEANTWLSYTTKCAIGTLVAAFLSIFIPIDKDATSAQIFQYISSKVIVLLVLLTATVWCGRVYKALMHQITVNRHRANALKTFQAFIQATDDDPTRNAVLLETTRSIFANSPSGYLDSADAASDTTGSRVFEIFKATTSSAKATG